MGKHFLISLITLLFVMPFINAQNTISILDSNFEQALIDLGIDSDGLINQKVLTVDVSSIVSLNVSNKEISDLSGIEGFTSLESLNCNNNRLTALDVTKNIALKFLLCSSNQLTKINIDTLEKLATLDCSNNQITELVLINTAGQAFNPLMTSLTCSSNRLTSIDVHENDALTFLNLSSNSITGTLNISDNLALKSLFCSSNAITSLDLSKNTLLTNLDASKNQLTNLDLSTINTVACTSQNNDCQGKGSINVSRNQLVSLIVANGSNNTLISAFNSQYNPDLFCIQIDSGFTPPLTGNTIWVKDAWTYYNDAACTDIYTYIPDDNFEAYLEGLNPSLGDGIPNNNFVLTQKVSQITSLNVSNKTITDFTGIEDFVLLVTLDFSDNDLKTVDLSKNIALKTLDCSNNALPGIDLKTNVQLENLNCSNNKYLDPNNSANNYSFNQLDLANNTSLITLDCSMNKIEVLDLKLNTSLSTLDCSTNNIGALDLSLNTALTSLECQNNIVLGFLNIKNGANTALATFNAEGNVDLYCIQVDNVATATAATTAGNWKKEVTASYNINCGTYVPDNNFEQELIKQNIDTDGVVNNFVATSDINAFIALSKPLNISNLLISDLTGIEAFAGLKELNCSGNNLTRLDLKANTTLTTLNCSINQIENLDFSNNGALTNLNCSNNALLTLDLKNTSLTTLDATGNLNLYCVNVADINAADAATAAGNWKKETIASYNNNCIGGRFTEIPDDTFYEALVALGFDADDADPATKNTVLISKIEHLKTLDVSNKDIKNLTGIKEFKLLKELDCSANYLNELDLIGMRNLERLNCASNAFLTTNTANTLGLLNITGTDNLIDLFCGSNYLKDLDVSLNLKLEELDCSNNNLDAVILNTDIKILNISNNYLKTIDITANTNIIELNCNNNQILSVKGSVNNLSLKKLSTDSNGLKVLDVSYYTALTNLSSKSNVLTELLLSSNKLLDSLDFTSNKIAAIVLTDNTALTLIQGGQNELTGLDLSTNTALKTLKIDNNKINNLILSSNNKIKYLFGSSNQLTSLDISNLTELVELNVSSNMLSELTLATNLGNLRSFNVSKNVLEVLLLDAIGVNPCPTAITYPGGYQDSCPEKISINVSNNQLGFLSVKNVNYANITSFNATLNPSLNCIEIDNTFTLPNGPDGWLKETTAEYNENCHFGETYVPDDNFEQALINLGYDQTGILDDYVLTANIKSITDLTIANLGILNLTGLEDFSNLKTLNCSGNILDPLYVLNLKKNTSLEVLDCSNTGISDLDLSLNTALTNINCSGNNLTVLDLSKNIALKILNLSNNKFTEFDSSDFISITSIIIDGNSVKDLDFSANTALTNLSCVSNPLLTTLNLKNGKNASLASLDATNNPNLTCITADSETKPSGVNWSIDATASYSMDCHYYQTNVPDDAFEQALINQGYDIGPLDDYVPTIAIEKTTSLSIKNLGIKDVTGLEDFNALISLDCSFNELTTLDVSNNTALETINASNNKLNDLPLVSNVKLLNLKVSNNLLTSISINNLQLLETLYVSSNQLESIDVSSNSNLIELYCQNNLLTQDKLNIKNGNNQNLNKLNTTGNPNLECILVDDAAAVIFNQNGHYDLWYKDDTANYQEICADADNDGVANADDNCGNTPFGVPVDLFGCPYLVLDNENFNILITGETCISSNNGKIYINTIEAHNYIATITGDKYSNTFDFTNDLEIRNLLAGSYRVCITIENNPDVIFCYDIVITQPLELSVISRINQTDRTISFDLSGSSNYTIEVNGLVINTSKNEITLALNDGVNTIKINTDLECQGAYEENIFLSEDLLIYPNPFENQFKVYLGNTNSEKVDVNIFSSLGQKIISHSLLNKNGFVSIDGSDLQAGVYFVTIKLDTVFKTFKIIKK